MKGEDLLKKIKLEEYREKADILKKDILNSQDEIKGLENRRESFIRSLRSMNKELSAAKERQKVLLEKNVNSVELPEYGPGIFGVDFANRSYLRPAFNCRCGVLPKKYVRSLEYGAPTCVAGERIEAGELVTYNHLGVLMKTHNYDGFGRLIKT